MSRVPDNSSLKRKRPDAATKNLSDAERNIYEVIHKKANMGIWTRDIRREINLPDTIFNKALKVLVTKNLIKEVVNIQNKTKKHYMAVEFEPSKELTGGTWYVDGKFDHEFIKVLKDLCKKIIQKEKLATIKSVSDAIKKSGLLNVECSMQQVADIMQSLIFDNEIMEDRSSGTLCYKLSNKAAGARGGAFASIPCGVCPRINDCTPDGIISPTTCVYYNKWLDF
ncbi:hypothetical protein ACHQM5_012793 [Ranunculus cassubicifolius]